MGRKRLLTILAGVVAAIGLQLGPAAALDVETDVGDAGAEASVSTDGVEVEVSDGADDADDTTTADDADGERTTSAKVSADDGVEATAGDTEVTSKDVTESVDEPTGGETPESPTSKPGPTSDDDDGGTGSGSDDSGSDDAGSDEEVTTAGRAKTFDQANGGRPGSLDPEQARQFLAGSRETSGRDGGGVTPAFDLSGSRFGDLDDPMVAAPSDTATEHEWESASPETAPRRSDAELAAIPAPSPDDVPVGLKLVAAMLVAGTGTLWHLTRRELQPSRA